MQKSPLTSAAESIDSETIEAFRLVGDETRLAILLALWDAYDRPDAADNALSFSALFSRVQYNDRGNFRYHLRQLEGQYVRRTNDDKYELRHTGLKLVQTVISGAGVRDTEVKRAEIDRTCELCGTQTAIRYEDGIAFHVCTNCEGKTSIQEFPNGYLNSVAFPPAGVPDREPDELIAAAEIVAYRKMRTMFQGVCATCSGPVTARLELCTDHQRDGTCEHCGRKDAVLAAFRCQTCKDSHAAPPSVLSVFHPAVVAFYYDHGVSIRWHAEEFDGLTLVGDYEPEFEQEIVSEEPSRVTVTISLDGDELSLTFDESVSIVDIGT
jgi:ssDNA-binding Zn-finger/Zn-ribbon topoisomerase 1